RCRGRGRSCRVRLGGDAGGVDGDLVFVHHAGQGGEQRVAGGGLGVAVHAVACGGQGGGAVVGQGEQGVDGVAVGAQGFAVGAVLFGAAAAGGFLLGAELGEDGAGVRVGAGVGVAGEDRFAGLAAVADGGLLGAHGAQVAVDVVGVGGRRRGRESAAGGAGCAGAASGAAGGRLGARGARVAGGGVGVGGRRRGHESGSGGPGAVGADPGDLGADLGGGDERLPLGDGAGGGAAVVQGQVAEQVVPGVGGVLVELLLGAAGADVGDEDHGFFAGHRFSCASRARARARARFIQSLAACWWGSPAGAVGAGSISSVHRSAFSHVEGWAV